MAQATKMVCAPWLTLGHLPRGFHKAKKRLLRAYAVKRVQLRGPSECFRWKLPAIESA